MSLAFLAPAPSRGHSLSGRSPMERAAVAAGGRLQSAHGWNVVCSHGERDLERRRVTETVAFADRSQLGKFELLARPHALARVLGGLTDEPAPPAGAGAHIRAGARAPGWWCNVTPQRALVLCEPAATAELREGLACAERDHGARVVELTCGLAAMTLAGPAARELLARFCALDVRPRVAPPGSFRPGSVARTPGYVLVEGPERLLVLVGWALGEYLWHVVADAAAQLGGGPVAAESLAQGRCSPAAGAVAPQGSGDA